MEKATQIYKQLGSTVHQSTVKKNFWNSNYKVVVVDEDPAEDSPLAKLGIRKNDKVSKINGKRVKCTEDLAKALRKEEDLANMKVKVIRDGISQELAQ